MTREQFAEGLAFYRECCGQKLTKDRVDVWWEMLKDMPYDQFVGGVKTFICKEKEPASKNFVASVLDYSREWVEKKKHEQYLERKRVFREQEDLYRQKVIAEHKMNTASKDKYK